MKLCTRAIDILIREVRNRSTYLRGLPLRPPPSRVISEHALLNHDFRVSGGFHCFHYRSPFPRFRFWLCSPYSTELDRGVIFSCWNCKEPSSPSEPFLSCRACRAVQPPDLSVNFFQIFGLEQRYAINDENLEAIYKAWQKKLHPDTVHSKSEKEKAYATEQSARVIDAYHTLSKPLSKALYLLQLAGVVVDEEKTVMDPELLSEMMDLREAVEEASDPKALMQIQCQIERKHMDWSNSFREVFNKGDFHSAIAATQKMRYYERAMEEIVKKL